MVSGCSPAKRQLFLQKVSSKLGPSIRHQERGIRPEQEPSGQRTGLTGQGIPRPLSEYRQIQSQGTLLLPLCVLSVFTMSAAQGLEDNEERFRFVRERK